MINGIVYMMTFPNGKKYIGSRYGSDLSLNNYLTSSKYVLQERKDFGEKQWDKLTIKQVLCECETKEETLKKEFEYQKMHDVVNNTNFLNKCFTEKNFFFGHNHGEISRKKMSISRKGKKIGSSNPMFGRTGSRHHFYGGTHSESAKNKMSLVNSGKKNPAIKPFKLCFIDGWKYFSLISEAVEKTGIPKTTIIWIKKVKYPKRFHIEKYGVYKCDFCSEKEIEIFNLREKR